MLSKEQHLIDSANIVLKRFPWLSAQDEFLFAGQGRAARRFQPHEDLLSAQLPSPGIYAIRSGIACRYAILPNGQRQIVGFILPGELCDSRAALFDHVDYSVCALQPVEAVLIPNEYFATPSGKSASFLRALWRVTAVEDAIDRQWLLNLGQRSALERVAHLLCELFARLQSVGLTDHDACEFPLTQTDIGEATALSTVHVNRTVMELRHNGCISLRRHRLTLHDPEGLKSIAGFSPDYLAAREPRRTSNVLTLPSGISLSSP